MWKTQLEIKAVSKDYGVSQISLPKVVLRSFTFFFLNRGMKKRILNNSMLTKETNQPKEKPKLAL